jgi:cysteine-rich repeat protein
MSRRVHDQTIFRRYPYPLAQAWARARSLAVNDAERVSYACGALELFLRYFAAICVQDYLRGPTDLAVEKRLGDLSRVSCGQWLRLCREASRSILARNSPAPFLPELAIGLSEDGALMARLDRLVEERNRSFAHATQPPPAELARAAQALLDGLAEVLDDVAYLADWRPFSVVTEARTRSGATRGKLRFYTGQLLETEPRHATWDGPLVREALYLASSDGRIALELTPLISVRDDAATRREALFLWEGTDREDVKLVTRSLDTGREEATLVLDDGAPVAFSGWLAGRGERSPVVDLGAQAQGFGTRLPDGIPATVLASVSERFEFIEPLGDGGMASVWRVRDRVTGDESALKVLKPGWADDPQSRDRFLREARTLIDVAHPHVVPVNELLEWGDSGLAIRMPVMTNGSVRDRAEGRPQPPAVVREWLRQALEALAFLHARGIVHRDVKPQNLLFDGDGWLRVADFGIALRPGDVRLTRTHESLGTIGYMAPEQLRGGRVGPAADIHALGVAAHEWLTGALPEGAAGTGIESELGPMLAEMTALEPSARPDAATLLVRLGHPAPAAAPGRITRPVRAPRPPRLAVAIVLSVLGLAAIAALARQWDRRSQGHPLTRLVNHAQCSNGAREPGEGCDDGNQVDTDGCSNDCLPNAVFFTGAGPSPDRNHWTLGSEKPCEHKAACAYEQPATPILMSPFWLARTETTIEAYVTWAERAGLPIDEGHRNKARTHPRLPASDVTIDAAMALCRSMGGRLPSEAEWEYAARDGGRDVEYPWGDAPPDCDRAVLGDHRCSLGRAWPVCSKPRGNSSSGVCDLAGNVWEWVVPAFPGEPNEDLVRPYPGLSTADPGADFLVPQYLPQLPGPKPIRGGGHWHTVAFWNRARARYAMPEGAHETNIGFRCAWDSEAFPLPAELDPIAR